MQVSLQTSNFLKSQTGQMFIGLILGDGTLTPYRFEHSQRSTYWEYSKHISQQFQTEYPQLLTPKIFNDFFYLKKRTNPESLIVYKSQTFYTKRHVIFSELYTIFYPQGKKVFPMAIIEEYFTEKSLFYLYLDDGRVGRYASSGLGFDLCNFHEQELIEFKTFLQKRFQLEITIHRLKDYLVLYVKMESSKQLLARLNQMTGILDSLGVIRETKLQLKKVDVEAQKLPSINPRETLIVEYKTDRIDKSQLIGLFQGFIIGGANFRWNKDCQTGYLRLRLKKQSSFTDYVLNILNQYQLKPKITNSDQNIQIGIKVNQTLSQYVKEVVGWQGFVKDPIPCACIENLWFWNTLFFYKGRDLSSQRGGLRIGLNHLSIKTVQELSDQLNNCYSLETLLQYRDKKTKASIYIPVKDRDTFSKLFKIQKISSISLTNNSIIR